MKFLWNQIFESTNRIAASIDNQTQIDNGGSGVILAHCMGLGKTFTTIVFIYTLFRYSILTRIHRVLILCPINTAIKYVKYIFLHDTRLRLKNLLHNENFHIFETFYSSWKNEFHHWLNDLSPTINVYFFNNDDTRRENREDFLRDVRSVYCLIFIKYNLFYFFSGMKMAVFY